MFVALLAIPAFAFDPSLPNQTGLNAGLNLEAGQYGVLEDGASYGMEPAETRMYGVSLGYQNAKSGTKVGVGGGMFALSGKDWNDDGVDYEDSSPYVSLGLSQRALALGKLELGVFGDGTYIFPLEDQYMGADIEISGLRVLRAGAIAQLALAKNLSLYAGANGQWIKGDVSLKLAGVELFSEDITNSEKLSGFGGVKYDAGPVTIDLNVGCADRPHAGANLSYNF